MEISFSLIANRAEVIEELLAIAIKHDDVSQYEAFESFLRSYIETFCLEEWIGRQFHDLYNACKGFYLFLDQTLGRDAKVRVFNPSLDEEGWICGRTVVLVSCVDSPFLVDSIRMELNRRSLPIHIVKSTVLNVRRDDRGGLSCVALSRRVHNPEGTQTDSTYLSKEALIYFEINALTDSAEAADLKTSIEHVLVDIQRVVSAYRGVVSRLEKVKDNISHFGESAQEVVDFLEWLPLKHFTFLGLREYDLSRRGTLSQANDQLKEVLTRRDSASTILPPDSALQDNSDPDNLDPDNLEPSHSQSLNVGRLYPDSCLVERITERLGIFAKLEMVDNIIEGDDFSKGIRDFYASDALIFFSKSSTRSNVHRAVHPDYLVVKKFDSKGNVCGEVRFLGLFTYNVSSLSPVDIPILRKKTQYIVNQSGVDPESHDGRALLRIIENYPKDELFQTSEKLLYSFVSNIAAINERHLVRLILRRDVFGHFVNCMVFVPRDQYTTQVRVQIEQIIGEAIGASHADSMTYFSESNLARAQIVFRLNDNKTADVNINELERKIAEVTHSWSERLAGILVDHYGESSGAKYLHRFKNAFPLSYQVEFDARAVIGDIQMLETLSAQNTIAMNFYQPMGYQSDVMRFKIMCIDSAIELSTVIPILENLGLRVLGEELYKIRLLDNKVVWMHDFSLKFGLPITLDVHAVKPLFESAFDATWTDKTESDAFNRLVLAARLNWHEVVLLRAYANYLKQTTFAASSNFIADTLVMYPDITRNLIALFKNYFDPRLNKDEKFDEVRADRLKNKIVSALDHVSNLNQDKVLRRYLDLIRATQRTNFFQKTPSDQYKRYLSLKMAPRMLLGIPEPRPLYEVFVYSPRVEGVHLRGDSVARGGLRWSDRFEDYRTEILGLVKAQQVKNAVIVPHGAKGGFVAKQLPLNGDRAARMNEGIECYKLFIRGLLDLTDNLVSGNIVPPPNVVRRDGDDPYLVVAADKGTATFSDIANSISLEYGHWLGDAFASGGSQGYDHKKMGITARGAWVSVQRHFRELGVDIQSQDFSVIGIGDMAGDVFGNGMLLSEHICLKAAFNHLHIFIDPQPHAKNSYQERQRLFETPSLGWCDYNTHLISDGGGVFSRLAKSIEISPQMQAAFCLTENHMTPNELIHALLKAPIDLLWNGGIGTYMKSSQESHAAVGDKANDGVRVNGNELRCKVIGEGGNLGFTQLGRIEFALNGGGCNTDFIDNAAGVDCSDHEVNIKILLDEVLTNGDMTSKQRNQFLAQMTDSVAQLVLQNNYRQTLAISVAQSQVMSRTNEYRRFISYLESKGKLNRELEFLPSDEDIMDRVGRGKALTRPELSVLISYAKVQLKEYFFKSDIADDEYISRSIVTAFPSKLHETFPEQIKNHRLKKEIVGTQIANDLVNNLGITAAHRLSETSGASLSDIAKAYVVSRDVFQLEEFQAYIQSLDNKVSAGFQSELMVNMVRRVRRGTRWFLRNRRSGLNPSQEITNFRAGLDDFNRCAASVVLGKERELWQARSSDFEEKGVDVRWAKSLSMPDNLFSGLSIIESSQVSNVSVEDVTLIFFTLLDRLSLNWFATQLSEVKVETYWQALARESFIDDLEAQLRRLSIAFLKLRDGRSIEETFDDWSKKNEYLVNRWMLMVSEVQSAQTADYAMFSVALRELIDLTQATDLMSSLH